MKRVLATQLSKMLFMLLLSVVAGQSAHAQEVQVSYQTFYDNLSPYGQWVSDPQYGNVWVPNEDGDFRPYGTRGHWVMTDYGNTWVSDDSWGWACYHYGRWTYNPYYNWVWIPGYEWAPAWVSWRYGGGYSGWAPLGPGMGEGGGSCPDSWWVFVQPQYMYENDCFHHWRGPSYNSGYIRQAGLINNPYNDNSTHVRYNYGPRADMIERDTHQPVQVYHVSASGRPGAPGISGHNVSMYRPTVNRATASTARPSNVIAAPRQIGRPQAATNVSAGHQPAFRQAQQAAHGGGNTAAGQRGINANPQPGNRQQPQGRPVQQPHQTQPANRPQQQQPQNRPQQQQHPQPQNRPQPQPRQQPMPQQRPQPQQRQQPMPQQRQQPMQQQHSQPMPHEEAPHEAPHEGGGRR